MDVEAIVEILPKAAREQVVWRCSRKNQRTVPPHAECWKGRIMPWRIMRSKQE